MRKLVIVLAFCVSAGDLKAQNTDIESLAGLLFNFGNPGARSLAMGGAFLGLADDASAAEANPAGLTALRKPEISVEVRNYEQKQFFSTTGTYPDVQRTGFAMKNRLIQPTFASFVYPIRAFAVGAYYHEALRNKGAGEVLPEFNPITGRVTANVPNFYLPRNGAPVSREECERLRQTTNDFFACLEYTIAPFLSTIDLKERTVGVVGAYKVRNISLGLTARYQRLTETANSTSFTPDFDVNLERTQSTGAGRNPAGRGKNERDITFTAGVKWSPAETIGLGAIYKQGGRFSSSMAVAAPETDFLPVKIADTTFHLPDVFGVGISLRPIPVLTVNVDAVRIIYSNLIDDFHSFNSDIEELGVPYVLKDATELRLGAEYFFQAHVPFAIRAGWWRDPPHNLEYRGPITTPDRVAIALLFPKGSAQRHLSVGAGWSWPRFEIDAAYDWASSNKVASLSVVERF